MRQTNAKLLAQQKPLSVIEVLTAGFETVRKRPWTLLIPIWFDVMIWLLPRLSLTALFRPALSGLFDTTGLSPDAAASAQEMQQAANQFVEGLNLPGLVSAALNSVTGLPALLAAGQADLRSPFTALAYTISLDSGLLTLFLAVPLFLIGLFFAALYIEWIAQGVRPLEASPEPLAGLVRVAKLWLKLIGLALLEMLVVLAAGLVLVVAQGFGGVLGDATSFLTGLVVVGLFWVFIYFFFTVPALAVGGSGLFEAIRRSILLFRMFFWAAMALVALSIFLDRGLTILWNGLLVTPLGVILGVVANAFIGTGLLAAAMVFYQDRMNYAARLLAQARVTRP